MTYDATDIIKNAKEELKRLSQNGFQDCFQSIQLHKGIGLKEI